MGDFSFAESARAIADRFLVPDGPARELLLKLGATQDAEIGGLDLIVVQRAYQVVSETVKELYRPRSPLEAQLEHDRARRDLAAQGIEVPEWVAAEDPVIAERWAEWNRRDATRTTSSDE